LVRQEKRLQETTAFFYFFIDCSFSADIFSAYAVFPTSLIWSMQAARSDLNMSPKIFEIKLLNFLQWLGLLNSLHSEHEEYPYSKQHDLILHQDAFALS
jgi:hypothetical protein